MEGLADAHGSLLMEASLSEQGVQASFLAQPKPAGFMHALSHCGLGAQICSRYSLGEGSRACRVSGIAAVEQCNQLQQCEAKGGGKTMFRSSLIPRVVRKDPIFSKQGHFALTRSTRIMGPW